MSANTMPRLPEVTPLTDALLQLVLVDQSPPCAGRDEWTSEDEGERTKAAGQCGPCPVRAECALSAETNRERFGVWAGVDRTDKQRVGRPRKALVS